MTHNGSTCGSDTQAALLAVQFGDGHSWSVNFTKSNETYQAEFITFTYNTNDTAVFPDARRQGSIISCPSPRLAFPKFEVLRVYLMTSVQNAARSTCVLEESAD